MIIPAYRTWVAGEVVTASYLNTNIRNAGNFWLSVPVFEGVQTVAQSIPTGVVTAVLLDTEEVDNDNGHSTTVNTSRYASQTPGRFQISGGASYAANATGRRGVLILVNGTQLAGSSTALPTTGALDTGVPLRTRSIYMNGATDYIELGTFQDSGAPLNTFVTGSAFSTLSVRWVGTT
jgi:hypothetical protein